ncbi:MAG: hypothetical protein GXO63_03495 [Candidatus Micrarchaeota archaeon]|nr:hypothetical protein [Candidatus Micrarchaeota archaeon]
MARKRMRKSARRGKFDLKAGVSGGVGGGVAGFAVGMLNIGFPEKFIVAAITAVVISVGLYALLERKNFK